MKVAQEKLTAASHKMAEVLCKVNAAGAGAPTGDPHVDAQTMNGQSPEAKKTKA